MKASELKVGDRFTIPGATLCYIGTVYTCERIEYAGAVRASSPGGVLPYYIDPDTNVSLMAPEAKTDTHDKARTTELIDSLRAEHLSDYLAKRTQQFCFTDWLMEVAQNGHQEADEYLGMQQKQATSYTAGGEILEHRLQRMGMELPPALGKTINIWKAWPVAKNDTIESVTINIHETLPDVVYSDLNEWRMVAKKEAVELCDALCSTLPQGVVDALLVELLDRKRSLFIIPMKEQEKSRTERAFEKMVRLGTGSCTKVPKQQREEWRKDSDAYKGAPKDPAND